MSKEAGIMKILKGIGPYEVREANFEALRLGFGYMDIKYSPAYFHGIAGSVFRIGGICPCAPTCTTAMSPQELITLLGYSYTELPYESGEADEVERMIEAVRASIDHGIPALVWNAMTMCEWDVVTGYDEAEQAFYGRVPWLNGRDEYQKSPWDRSKEQAGLTGVMAIIYGGQADYFDREKAEIAALREAVRHGNDTENLDKKGGEEWVFLQGKAAYNRWADDFSKSNKERGLGDAYCMDIYPSCHARAGAFLREIAGNYPNAAEKLLAAAELFDEEADYLKQAALLLTWSSPEVDAERNAKVYPLLKGAAVKYGEAIDALEAAVCHL